MSVAAALIGSAISGGASIAAQNYAVKKQKELLDYQYEQYLQNAHNVGATPAAIAAGLTGHGASTIPAVASAPSMPDLGSTLVAAKQQRSSDYLNKAQIEVDKTQAELNRLNLHWNPQKWYSDVMKTWSEIRRNSSWAELDQSMSRYYNEIGETAAQSRPYQIDALKQGLVNAQAVCQKVLAEIETEKSKKRNLDSSTGLNEALKNESYSRSLNIDQEGFRLQFENALRSGDWNPSDNAWGNVSRLLFTNPDGVSRLLDNSIQGLNKMQDYVKQRIGERKYNLYKRGIVFGTALHYLNNRIGQHKTAKLQRLNLGLGAVSRFIPFTGSFNSPGYSNSYFSSYSY